jgi:hypothetical protein
MRSIYVIDRSGDSEQRHDPVPVPRESAKRDVPTRTTGISVSSLILLTAVRLFPRTSLRIFEPLARSTMWRVLDRLAEHVEYAFGQGKTAAGILRKFHSIYGRSRPPGKYHVLTHGSPSDLMGAKEMLAGTGPAQVDVVIDQAAGHTRPDNDDAR